MRLQKILYRSVGFGLNLLSLVHPKAAGLRAYRLFGKPPQPNIRPKEMEFLNTARIVERDADGFPITEYHWGEENKPYILLSYGWAYNAGRWRHFVPDLLSAGFRVIAFDPPGHGLNKRAKPYLNVVFNNRIIQDIIRNYGAPEAAIGHSFGGTSIVMALSQMESQWRPQRVALMASFSYAPDVFKEYRKALGLWPGTWRQMLQTVEDLIGSPIHAFDFALMSADLDGVYAMIVHDPEEKVTSFAHSKRYHSFWPDSVLLSVPGAGHHLGVPEVTESVVQFTIKGKRPGEAAFAEYRLSPHHELVRYFAGMEQ